MDAQVSPNSSSSDTGFDELMDRSVYGKNDNVSCVYFVNNKIPTVSVIELFELRSDFVPPTFNHLNDPN